MALSFKEETSAVWSQQPWVGGSSVAVPTLAARRAVRSCLLGRGGAGTGECNPAFTLQLSWLKPR